MTVSIRRLSLGAGFAYLMDSVARGDGAGGPSSLTRYYAESGTPPGYWLGAGLAGLADGAGLEPGSVVSEEQLWRLLGMLADPVSGEPLGHAPRRWPGTLSERIAARVAALDPALSDTDRAALAATIEVEERRRETRVARPVAAFDLTFSVPKSVSVVWALADPATREAIHQAHRDAIAAALEWAQREIVFTRTGVNGAFQEPVRGVVAAAFDHWDSRAGDPHLHTHVVVANRVQTADGRWRTLDSRTLHRYTVALSELHEGVLQDLLTARLGYSWTARTRRHSVVPRWDITGVPTDLLTEFSQRSTQIQGDTTDLITAFAATHGRHPTDPELLRLRQQATLQTRPNKQHHSLAQLCQHWRDRSLGSGLLEGQDPVEWTRSLHAPITTQTRPTATVDASVEERVAAAALQAVSTKRATFRHANVLAEVHRQLHGHHFPNPTDRLAAADRITTRALDLALPLNPAPDPAEPRQALHKGAAVYSTRAIFDAETRLLDAGRDTTAPALPHPHATTTATTAAADQPRDGVTLGPDQAAAVVAVATSGRRLDLLIGPAGTGKTTSLRALRAAWETHHGPGSVIGLAPSAAAAEVLAEQLGITTENTAKWLTEHTHTSRRDQRIDQIRAELAACSSPGTVRARRLTHRLNEAESERDQWRLHPGQLLIIDEASLAATLPLDAIVTHASAVGAKVLLVGDPRQLGPVDAGGAFAMLTHDRDGSPAAELTEPRRFSHDWERHASLQLRAGDPAAITAYSQHGRIHASSTDDALDLVLHLWATDRDKGLDTVMIAIDHDTVTQLNQRARAQLIRTGHVTADGVRTADGAAGIGDHIITRHNDRTLRHGPHRKNWVRNGDTWTITAIRSDGSITARNPAGSTVTLDPAYVRQHVQLGYALTATLAQGRTLDTGHVLVNSAMGREALYVAATRARHTNTLTITLDHDSDPATVHNPASEPTATDILTAVLARSSTDTSAHSAVTFPPTSLVVPAERTSALSREIDVPTL